MNQKIRMFMFILMGVLIFSSVAFAGPGKPNFGPSIYADGETWGTKATTVIPAPNEHNLQSFDMLFVVTNSNADGQLPVGEAAPRNPDYNGGRWFTHTVEWTADAFGEFDTFPLLTSYDDILHFENEGFLEVMPGSFDGGPPPYFQCPLLPVKN
jgi:hypothetical protein